MGHFTPLNRVTLKLFQIYFKQDTENKAFGCSSLSKQEHSFSALLLTAKGSVYAGISGFSGVADILAAVLRVRAAF